MDDPGAEERTATALEGLVEQNLSLHLHDNAVFYAERLFAATASPRSLYVLADTHLRIGGVEGAARILRHYFPFPDNFPGPATEGHRRDLTKLHYLYGVCLVKTQCYQEADHVFRNIRGQGTPSEQSATHYWLGVVQRTTNRDPEGAKSFVRSAELNPFNWCAVEGSLAAGADAGAIESLFCRQQSKGATNSIRTSTPANTSPATMTPLPAPMKLSVDRRAAVGSGSPAMPAFPSHGKRLDFGEEEEEGEECREVGEAAVAGLLREIIGVVEAGCHYHCAEVARRVYAMAPQNRKTGYIQGLLAKAYYDEGLYQEASAAFEVLRMMEPYRLDPKLVFFSSCLWQLQLDKKLAILAQELIQIDKLSSITQVVLGNTHSIIGEHETAIQFFTRACSVDRHDSYAYALRGMEHLVLEELDDAVQAFRTSLRLDSRSYPAWHGLGSVAVKQEQWKDAVVHFRKASTLNPNPPLLLAYAHALMEEQRPGCVELALSTLEKVLRKQPQHPLARLRKGEILLKCNRVPEARDVALDLLETAPGESRVNLLLGRIYRKLGDRVKALQYLNFAMGLDPKDTPAIKYEVDKFQDGIETDEEDEEADEP